MESHGKSLRFLWVKGNKIQSSNALRKAAEEKESALEKIEDELRELAKKSSNLWTNLQ